MIILVSFTPYIFFFSINVIFSAPVTFVIMALPTSVTQLPTIVKPSLPTVNPTDNMLEMLSDTIILPPPLQSSSKNAFDPHCLFTVEGRLQYLVVPQTWAECNSAAPMQPPSCPSVESSEAVKATKRITYEANKRAAALLDADIRSFTPPARC